MNQFVALAKRDLRKWNFTLTKQIPASKKQTNQDYAPIQLSLNNFSESTIQIFPRCPQFDPAKRKGMTETNPRTTQSAPTGGKCGKGRASHLKYVKISNTFSLSQAANTVNQTKNN